MVSLRFLSKAKSKARGVLPKVTPPRCGDFVYFQFCIRLVEGYPEMNDCGPC